MNLIIPYEENIYTNGGAFIKSDGEFIYTHGPHEQFAQMFCNGPEYPALCELKTRDTCIDVYRSSKLTSEQLAIYKLWLTAYEFAHHKSYADFMVSVLGFDKADVILQKTISTTVFNPHVRFFNYYLMDWYIDKQYPLIYDPEKGLFMYRENNSLIEMGQDREYAEEIEEIKSRVLLKDRPLFFR